MNRHLQDMCCLCLTSSNEQVVFNELNSKCKDDLSHLDKIAASLLELSTVMETDCKICNKCSETVDFIYNFNKTCIKNISSLTFHKKLSHESKGLAESEIEFEAEFISETESNENNEDKPKNEDGEINNLLNFEMNLNEPELEYLESDNGDIRQPIQDCQSPENHENFTCHLCERKFRYKSNLRLHLKVHAGEKSFKCHLCGKSFLHRGNLNRHLLTHTGLKLYQCEYCEKSFARKSSLDTHRFAIHGQVRIQQIDNPNELKYELLPTKQKRISKYEQYITLEKTMTNSENRMHEMNQKESNDVKVNDHQRDFICDECGKMFNTKSNLKIHLMSHTGERPFPCFVCDKSFIHKGNLNRHLLTHRYTVHKCDKCEKTFTLKIDFEQHLSLVHNVQKLTSQQTEINCSLGSEEDLEDRLVIDESYQIEST